MLKGCIFVPEDIDHKKFLERFYELLEQNGWHFQGVSEKLFEKEDENGREKRD
jgi:chemotaxis methyl-accepting protein methylase